VRISVFLEFFTIVEKIPILAHFLAIVVVHSGYVQILAILSIFDNLMNCKMLFFVCIGMINTKKYMICNPKMQKVRPENRKIYIVPDIRPIFLFVGLTSAFWDCTPITWPFCQKTPETLQNLEHCPYFGYATKLKS